jgi:hypothetical protein
MKLVYSLSFCKFINSNINITRPVIEKSAAESFFVNLQRNWLENSVLDRDIDRFDLRPVLKYTVSQLHLELNKSI